MFQEKEKKFVDLQDDVTETDITLAHREGYVSVEHLKRYTTLGMGTDRENEQPKRAGHYGGEEAETIEKIGTTTFRPPYAPIALGPLAGGVIWAYPTSTPGVRLFITGIAKTAQYLLRLDNGSGLNFIVKTENLSKANMDATMGREVQAVRNAVGLVDVSTLGKIDIQGKDSAEFLNRIYTNGWKSFQLAKPDME